MARQKGSSILGNLRGRVGTVVFTDYNGTPVVKSLPTRKEDWEPTARQLKVYARFRVVMDFLQLFKPVIDIGFVQPRKSKMSGFNKAVSYHLLNVLNNKQGQPKIDFEKVIFSKPLKTTQQCWNAKMIAEEGRKITVSWQPNPYPDKGTEPDDHIILAFYCKENNIMSRCVTEGVFRTNLTHSSRFSESTIGHEIVGYMFVVSPDGKLVSETEYLGTVIVLP